MTAPGGLTAHLVPVDEVAPFSAYAAAQAQQDEPFVGTTHYLHWGLYGAAQGQVRVMLEGHGGDSVVSHGMTRLTELTARGQLGALLREARAYGRREGWPLKNILLQWSVMPFIPGALRRWRRDRRDRAMLEERMAEALLQPELAARTRLLDRLLAVRAQEIPARSVRAEQEEELSSHFYSMVFEWFNITAHHFALEVNYPFFDRRLAELCIALPASQKLRDGWTRYVLRQAMGGILPETVQWRSGKANLSPAFYGNLRARDGALLGRTIADGLPRLAPYLQTDALTAGLQAFSAGDTLLHWERYWFAATLAAWQTGRAARDTAPLATA